MAAFQHFVCLSVNTLFLFKLSAISDPAQPSPHTPAIFPKGSLQILRAPLTTHDFSEEPEKSHLLLCVVAALVLSPYPNQRGPKDFAALTEKWVIREEKCWRRVGSPRPEGSSSPLDRG